MNTSCEILDIVATKKDFPDHNILNGQVGTIVEKLDENFFEVEFATKTEDSILIPIHKDHLILLHFELEKA